MINLLNHNTSYKHSKLSARPPFTMYCDRTQLPKLLDFPNFRSLLSICVGIYQYTNPSARRRFEYQSKPLLCWRYDSHFFNLQGFFFSILKALHTCWCFVKNNKKIVFVSTDNPSDTGHSGLIDHLTQTFAREFLPRIKTETPIMTTADKQNSKPFSTSRVCSRKGGMRALNNSSYLKSRHANNANHSTVVFNEREYFKTFEPETKKVNSKDWSTGHSNERELTKTVTKTSIEGANAREAQNRRAITHKSNAPAVSRRTLKTPSWWGRVPTNRKHKKKKSEPVFTNVPKQINMLSSLKNVINVGTAVPTQLETTTKPQFEGTVQGTTNFETSFLTNSVYHKLDGLLFRAASRSLSSSFSRLQAPFFSNAQASFQDKFSHLLLLSLTHFDEERPSLYTDNSSLQGKENSLTATKISKGFESKQLWPFNLNSVCSIGYCSENMTVSSYAQKKANKKIRSFGKIWQQRPQIFNVAKRQTKGRAFKKKQYTPALVGTHHAKTRDNKKPFTPKREFAYEFLQPVDLSVDTNIMRRRSAFNSIYRILQYCLPHGAMGKSPRPDFKTKSLWSLLFGQSGRRRNGRTDNKGVHNFRNRTAQNKHSTNKYAKNKYKNKYAKRKATSQMTLSRQPYIGWRNLPNNTRTFVSDFYRTHTRLKAYERMKTFAYNPYLLHADLVFFVNPDKNPGLASQIQKLGIPSIGIVSGLKSTAYRKQPHYSNLNNSVTYPILGNPDNLLFVTMVVRIFVRLIDNVQYNKL